MSTSYSSIYELFLAAVRDYQIDRLFNISTESAEAYMKSFLIRGLVHFKNCKQNLEDRNDTTQVFNVTLNTNERVILSNLMLVEWLTKEVNDVLQMRLHLQDGDFKTYSEQSNLRGKIDLLNNTREVVEKQMNQYGYSNLDWSTL